MSQPKLIDYAFTAFRTERYAANGTVKAQNPEKAVEEISRRYYEEDIDFSEYADGDAPDHFLIEAPGGEVIDIDHAMPDLTHAFLRGVRDLLAASDALHSAIEGTTDQFKSEVSGLSAATSALEKLIEPYKDIETPAP